MKSSHNISSIISLYWIITVWQFYDSLLWKHDASQRPLHNVFLDAWLNYKYMGNKIQQNTQQAICLILMLTIF